MGRGAFLHVERDDPVALFAATINENDATMADPETHAILAESAAGPNLSGPPRNTLLRPLPEFRPETWTGGGPLRLAMLAALAPHPDVLAGLPVIDAAAARHGLVAHALMAQIGGPVPPYVVSNISAPAESFGDRFEAFSADLEVAPLLQRTAAHRFGTYLSQELPV